MAEASESVANSGMPDGGFVKVPDGAALGDDAAFDDDLKSTITGGTVLMVGSSNMAQNFTSGTQPFAFTGIGGVEGDAVRGRTGDLMQNAPANGLHGQRLAYHLP